MSNVYKCSGCGADLTAGAVSCPACGQAVQPQQETQAAVQSEPRTDVQICAACGTENLLNAAVCTFCRLPLTSAQQRAAASRPVNYPPPPPKPPKAAPVVASVQNDAPKKSKLPLFIGIGVAIVAAIILLVVLLTGGQSDPAGEPGGKPTATVRITAAPTATPTDRPTDAPTATPTERPTDAPTATPTARPTEAPTATLTDRPTDAPTDTPTDRPTEAPTATPTEAPMAPTFKPTERPTEAPTATPTARPTEAPTAPTFKPTERPTEAPTATPTARPTEAPTAPTFKPTERPTEAPTATPTERPTAAPTPSPTPAPTATPTAVPTATPRVPIAGTSDAYQVEVLAATANSYLPNQKSDYSGAMTIDGREETCWQFSTKYISLGDAALEIDLAGSSIVDELWLKNGFWTYTNGLDQYTRNCRPKKIAVSFLYEGEKTYRDEEEYILKDDKERKNWQIVPLGRHENVCSVRIRVLSIYQGTKFKTDVAVSEVMLVEREGGSAAVEYETLKRGSKGPDVLAMKVRMQELGYFSAGAELSENYNDTCVERVKQFQKVNGLPQTGVADHQTLALLYSDAAKPKK